MDDIQPATLPQNFLLNTSRFMLDIMEKFLYNAKNKYYRFYERTRTINILYVLVNENQDMYNGLGAKYDPKNRKIESKII